MHGQMYEWPPQRNWYLYTVIYDIFIAYDTYISKLLCKAVKSVYSMIQLPLCIS